MEDIRQGLLAAPPQTVLLESSLNLTIITV